ncbi:MAG TPA: UDP-N-acetylglucosamine 2-epimerase (non-hydrolyzing), partial [Bacteroidales bacterium]|nr:UDP-N-acetylglucosamine 2-epimerase (non-hydrolyzing) [Bacteroidales bacterium]
TMIEFEKVIRRERPDWVIVVGDVNATLACSVTAKKEHIRVAHIEAGLRSRDRTMPEEINRLVTDSLSDLLFTPDLLAGENLLAEGVPEEKIRFVGNIMIDTMDRHLEQAKKLDIEQIIRENLIARPHHDIPHGIPRDPYALMTLHRPSNVDRPEILVPLIRFLTGEVCRDMKLIWPVHPRALKQLETFSVMQEVMACPDLILLHPIGYLEMLRLNMDARIMLTDSGGLQEECTVLGTPCLTLRRNTERPVTLREHGGASILVGEEIEKLRLAWQQMSRMPREPYRPSLWDGHTAERIVEILVHET